MSDMDALYTGLRNALVNNATLTALVSQRVYKKMQPATSDALPYVTYYISAGGYENIVAGDLLNVMVTVEAWASSDQEAADVFDAIRATLHGSPFSISGWNNFWVRAERVFDLPPEIVEGRQYFRMAADFRIRANKN